MALAARPARCDNEKEISSSRRPQFGDDAYITGFLDHVGRRLRPILIILGGLPGTGKTTIARELALQIGAIHLRIDSIEQAIRSYGAADAVRNGAGYRVAYALAGDNLRIGHTVIADSVNPLHITRDAWVEVAGAAQVRAVEIELTCGNSEEHQRRVETRVTDIPGLRLPAWRDVVAREYDSWNRDHLVIDTCERTVDETVKLLREVIEAESDA